MLNEVISRGRHLLNLINDVLDISKIEAGSLALLVQDETEVTDIPKAVMNTGKALIGAKPVELRLDLDEALPQIRADRQRITQVMLNILTSRILNGEHVWDNL